MTIQLPTFTPRRSVASRFWPKVDTSGGSSACWPWTASMSTNGYGQFKVIAGKSRNAHRIAWCLANDIDVLSLSPDTVIRHACDTPICCNPAHLAPGTRAENVRDMDDRGRRCRAFGEDNPNSRLTEDDVKEIRRRASLGHVQREIASDFGVAQQTISKIAGGIVW